MPARNRTKEAAVRYRKRFPWPSARSNPSTKAARSPYPATFTTTGVPPRISDSLAHTASGPSRTTPSGTEPTWSARQRPWLFSSTQLGRYAVR
jgi:hypothetical protein